MAQGELSLFGLCCPIFMLGVTLVCFQGRGQGKGPFTPSLSHLLGGEGGIPQDGAVLCREAWVFRAGPSSPRPFREGE